MLIVDKNGVRTVSEALIDIEVQGVEEAQIAMFLKRSGGNS